MSHSLTARQAELLAFLRERVRTTGVAPSFTEMMAHLGTRSKGNINRLLKAIERKGHIRREPGHARSYELLGHSPECPHCGLLSDEAITRAAAQTLAMRFQEIAERQ